MRIGVQKGKPAGSMPSITHLSTMLASEVFLQQFRPLDLVVTSPMYLPGFVLTQPGDNDGGLGQRLRRRIGQRAHLDQQGQPRTRS